MLSEDCSTSCVRFYKIWCVCQYVCVAFERVYRYPHLFSAVLLIVCQIYGIPL